MSTTVASSYESYPMLDNTSANLPDATCTLPHCAGSPIDMPSPKYPSGCEECVTECDIRNCDLSAESAQCTERCTVVPCDDLCFDVCGTTNTSWTNSICTDEQCRGFEELLEHCTEKSCAGVNCTSVSSQIDLQQDRDDVQRLDWDNPSTFRELNGVFCACDTQPIPHPFSSKLCSPDHVLVNDLRAETHRHNSFLQPSNPVPVSGPSSPASPLFSSLPSSSGSSRSSPDPLAMYTSQLRPEQSAILEGDHTNRMSYEQRSPQPLFCLWANCGEPFTSFKDLITHVNTCHFHLAVAQGGATSSSKSSSLSKQSSEPHLGPDPLSCMWGKCNLYPAPSNIPSSSVANTTGTTLGFLASHFLQDHLGISAPLPSIFTLNKPNLTEEAIPRDAPVLPATFPLQNVVAGSDSPRIGTPPAVSTTESKSTGAELAKQHFCKWQSCPDARSAFASSADLTAHITQAHVGGGKARYHCMWEGCNRHGDEGFSSKQKILRHIQSHTGHRPFRCKTCDQYFSEAATLQQHMRRHTKEKPYTCDFPGCNKAFAITGALTIHRRCHSGVKPFKCTYCDRSFSESSNLSKHIRTHTGDRPYTCPHPGCGKRFARPDQVARHMNVHKKKKQAEGTGTTNMEDEAMNVNL